MSITNLLDEANPGTRWWAAKTLGNGGDPKAVEALINKIRDDDAHVRAAVIKALGRLGDGKAVIPLVKAALMDGVDSVQAEAMRALAELDDPRASGLLIENFKNENKFIRARAAIAFRYTISSDAVLPLIHLLKDDDWLVRDFAANALGSQRDLRAVGPLVGLLQDKRPEVQSSAVEALGKLQSSEAIGPLVQILTNKVESIPSQKDIAEALENIDLNWRNSEAVKEAFPLLTQKLQDKAFEGRPAIAVALGYLGDRRAIESLLCALADADNHLHRSVVFALGKLQDPQGFGELKNSLTHKDREVRATAAEALGSLGDTRAVEPLGEALLESDYLVSSKAAIALGYLGDPRAVEFLFGALSRGANETRTAAAEALGMIGSPHAVSPLVMALNDPNYAVREAAFEALNKIDTTWRDSDVVRDRIPTLKALLDDSDQYVRAASVVAMGFIGDPRYKHRISNLCQRDKSDFVRTVAAKALGLFGDEKTLHYALQDKCQFVREAAEQALESIERDPAITTSTSRHPIRTIVILVVLGVSAYRYFFGSDLIKKNNEPSSNFRLEMEDTSPSEQDSSENMLSQVPNPPSRKQPQLGPVNSSVLRGPSGEDHTQKSVATISGDEGTPNRAGAEESRSKLETKREETQESLEGSSASSSTGPSRPETRLGAKTNEEKQSEPNSTSIPEVSKWKVLQKGSKGSPTVMQWNEASDYADSQPDWRLPTAEELKWITSQEDFQGPTGFFWTSSGQTKEKESVQYPGYKVNADAGYAYLCLISNGSKEVE